MSDPTQKAGAVLLEHAPIPIAVIDRDHRLQWCNPPFRALFGDRDGAPCYEVVKGRDAVCEGCVARDTFRERTHGYSAEEGVDAGGRMVHYELYTAPLGADEGPVDHVLLMAVDTTRAATLEGELRQSERLAVVGLTAAGLAHTIKNIIGGMEGAIYTVDTAIEKDDRARLESGWEMVQEYIQQVNALIRNLLQYARERAPTRELRDPGELAREMVRLYADKGLLVGVEVEAEVAPDLPKVAMDPQVMHACLANLVSNAMDACMWDPDDEKRHRVAIVARARDGGGVCFEVRDNGTGISTENQRRILQASFTTKGIRGTGLGLLLTRKAVEQHRGTIRFDSTPGEGTTFVIELPAGDEVEAAAS